MTKNNYEMSAKLLRLANRGAHKAQERARKANVPVSYAFNGKLITVKL